MMRCVFLAGLVCIVVVAKKPAGAGVPRRAPAEGAHVVSSWNSSYASASARYGMVFVGGYHYSGTSLVEKLLSSQMWAIGLVAEGFHGSLPGCEKSDCRAPEEEGVFLTHTYQVVGNVATGCKPKAWINSGECAKVRSEAAQKVSSEQSEAEALASRNEFWRDLTPFWHGCDGETRYLVEKDIANLYRMPFQDHLHGAHRTAYVIVLRHPFAQCRVTLQHRLATYRSCLPARERLGYWLDAHDVALSDVSARERAVVFQLERLIRTPNEVLAHVGHVLGLDRDLTFTYHQNKTVYESPGGSRRLNLDKTSVRRDGLIEIEAPDSAHLLDKSRQYAAMTPPVEWSARERNRTASFCYDLASLDPIVRGDCEAPVLRSIRTRPPRVDDDGPHCDWQPLWKSPTWHKKAPTSLPNQGPKPKAPAKVGPKKAPKKKKSKKVNPKVAPKSKATKAGKHQTGKGRTAMTAPPPKGLRAHPDWPTVDDPSELEAYVIIRRTDLYATIAVFSFLGIAVGALLACGLSLRASVARELAATTAVTAA